MAWIRGKLLGAGTFGSVNLAIQRGDGAVFAVKSVVSSEAGSEVALRAIENEISLLQGLDSEYVVKCLGGDWTEEGGRLMRNAFLEYMPEGCLVDFVRQFAGGELLDEGLLRKYTRSVVEGVHFLHSQGIVHCDIKGRNVLVGNGRVKLTDFGSAKRVGDVMRVNGTPLWMAPEVVRQVEQGLPSDIWSLGCTVVEMATGRAPWSDFGNQFAALFHIGCTDELPHVPAGLSAEARDFLSRCFQRDPAMRWTSAQLLQHPFLTSRLVEKTPASPVSVMEFPAAAEEDFSSEEDFSVPTLAAPSLFKRGLVVQQVEQGNWWSSPDSGPWIVVRSPKSASASSSFVVPEEEFLESSVVSLEESSSTLCESLEESSSPICENSSATVTESPVFEASYSTSEEEAVVCCSESHQIGGHFSVSACKYPRLATGLGKVPLFLEEGSYLNLRAVGEGLEHDYFGQYSNPQILLYWWPHNAMIRESSRGFRYLKSGRSDHCLLDEIFSIPLKLLQIISSCVMCTCFILQRCSECTKQSSILVQNDTDWHTRWSSFLVQVASLIGHLFTSSVSRLWSSIHSFL